MNTDTMVLVPAEADDLESLHAFFAEPSVHRYLFDGAAPSREIVASILARAADERSSGGGVWLLLLDPAERTALAGCGALLLDRPDRSAELMFALAPSHRGRGLASRMTRTLIGRAFDHPGIDRVRGGVDEPNAASAAVLRRAGLRFKRFVAYPAGRGLEFELRRDEALADGLVLSPNLG